MKPRTTSSAVLVASALLLTALSNMGCATARTFEEKVRSRAAFDLDCADVELSELSGGAYGVRGCGQKAACVLVPKSQNACSPGNVKSYAERNCSAVLNSTGTANRGERADSPPLWRV